MAHVNFKTINKLAKEGLVDGLPLKVFTNEHNCVACNKGKQHKASYKHISAERLITETRNNVQYGPFMSTNIRVFDQKVLLHKWNIGVIMDRVQKQKLIELCGEKGIKRDYSNPRTPQQNGVAERKNRTLIEAARTMLADSKLPTMFWTEAVSMACYVLNRVSITNPHNKTPYDLISGRQRRTTIQAEAEIRNQGVSLLLGILLALILLFRDPAWLDLAIREPAGIDSAVRDPAGIVSADGVSAGSPSAGSDPAGGKPADSFEPADESNPAVSSSVSADFNPVMPDSRQHFPWSILALKLKIQVLVKEAFIDIFKDQQRPIITDSTSHVCLVASFLSQLEPTSISKALEDPDWFAAIKRRRADNPLTSKWMLKSAFSLWRNRRRSVCHNSLKGFEDSILPKHEYKEGGPELCMPSSSSCHLEPGMQDWLFFSGTTTITEEPIEQTASESRKFPGIIILRVLSSLGPTGLTILPDGTFIKPRHIHAGSLMYLIHVRKTSKTVTLMLQCWKPTVICKKQLLWATSSTEAEYLLAASCCAQLVAMDYAAGSVFMLMGILLLVDSIFCPWMGFGFPADLMVLQSEYIHAAGVFYLPQYSNYLLELVCAGSIKFLLTDLFLLVVTCFCCLNFVSAVLSLILLVGCPSAICPLGFLAGSIQSCWWNNVSAA
ncbi:putative ribonuclease H-like domain-containing protein [Tanacetum coccineum]